MADFDTEDGQDPTDIHNKTQNLKLIFDKSDVRFFFIQFEMHKCTWNMQGAKASGERGQNCTKSSCPHPPL